MERFHCAAAAVARHEPVLGTASRVDRWVLVEAPGPWGPRALPQSRSLPDAALLTLQQRAKAAHARTLLIRRHRSPGVLDGPRRVFVAESRPGLERLLTRLVTDDEFGALDLPFDGPAPGWELAETLVGVCTHGTHDSCCAVRGRPVAAALAAAYPDVVWEISHIGGDRFAANVLVLPAGHYLGQLPPDDAAEALQDLLAGQRPDPWYRGRSCWSTPTQAAMALYAAGTAITGLDAVRPTGVERLGAADWRVTLTRTADDAPVEMVVAQRQGPERSRLTCHAEEDMPVPSWHLVEAADDQGMRTAAS